MRACAQLAAAVAVAALAVPGPALAGPANDGRKEVGTAQLLSGAGVGASSALFLAAFLLAPDTGDVNMPLLYAGLGTGVVTPSLGHYYAGEYLTVGMGIRTAAALLATYAVLEYRINVRCPTFEFDTSCTSLEHEAIGLLGVAAIAFVGGAAYDLKTLPGAVHRANARRGFTVAPILVPAPRAPDNHPRLGVPGLGLGVSGTW